MKQLKAQLFHLRTLISHPFPFHSLLLNSPNSHHPRPRNLHILFHRPPTGTHRAHKYPIHKHRQPATRPQKPPVRIIQPKILRVRLDELPKSFTGQGAAEKGHGFGGAQRDVDAAEVGVVVAQECEGVGGGVGDDDDFCDAVGEEGCAC